MDKRKKLVRLYNDIARFCREEGISAHPRTFLLNRFFFTVSGRRFSPTLVAGLSPDDFLRINERFGDRLRRPFVSSWSISYLLSLPHPAPMEATPHISAMRHDILFLSEALYLPYHLEKGHALHFSYLDEQAILSPFPEVYAYPLSKERPVEISVQATIFEILSEEKTSIRPYRFHLILDEAITTPLPQEGFFKNIVLLLQDEGEYLLHLKRNFLVSPATKKEKQFLYRLFSLREITKDAHKLVLHFGRRRPVEPERPITITDAVSGSLLSVPNDFIAFNNLLTFNDNLAYDEITLLQKIEEAGETTCGERFDFFIGMFPAHGVRPPVEKLRRHARYQPFVRGKDIRPFTEPANSAWILPEKEFFFQMPPPARFEQSKLIARYLSVRPVMCIDRGGLYFLSDVAAIVPRDPELTLEFAEAFFNSSLAQFYYLLKFTHHNKFLKKNFAGIPFIPPKKSAQRYIVEAVTALRSALAGPRPDLKAAEQHRRTVDRYIYQLFRLSPDEVRIIERFRERRV